MFPKSEASYIGYSGISRHVSVLLMTIILSGCGTQAKPTAQPSGFCDQVPHPVPYYSDIGPPAFKDWTEGVYAKWNRLCGGSPTSQPNK